PSKKKGDIITVKKGANNILVQPSDILWIAAEDYYSKLHTKDGDHLLRQPLKVLADRLPKEKFVQIHRSTIVNIDFVKEANSKTIMLMDGTLRSVSRQGYKRFSEFI
ncbi:MAG: LytR/AlgR family response regulator transcription factor, partial [Kordiimonas sp.]